MLCSCSGLCLLCNVPSGDNILDFACFFRWHFTGLSLILSGLCLLWNVPSGDNILDSACFFRWHYIGLSLMLCSWSGLNVPSGDTILDYFLSAMLLPVTLFWTLSSMHFLQVTLFWTLSWFLCYVLKSQYHAPFRGTILDSVFNAMFR